MANDCLVTKLKGSVDADLPVFDGVRIKVAAGQGSSIQIARVATTPEKVYGTRLLAVKNCSFSVTDHTTQETVTGTDVSTVSEHHLIISVLITDTTKVAEYIIYGVNSIKGMGSHDSFNRNNFGIADFGVYKTMPELVDVNFNSVIDTISINLDEFLAESALTIANLTYVSCNRASADYKTSGHLSSLNSCSGLKSLNLYNSAVSGEIKDFARAIASNGATSGQLSMNVYGSGVTFGGNPVASLSGWYIITWDASDVYMTQV